MEVLPSMKKEREQMNAKLRFVRKEVRYSMIAKAAYYRAEQRGFQNGDATGDWLAAEKETDEKLGRIFLPYSLSMQRIAELPASKISLRNNRAKGPLNVVIPILTAALFLVAAKKYFS
jgi:hypothetical protein